MQLPSLQRYQFILLKKMWVHKWWTPKMTLIQAINMPTQTMKHHNLLLYWMNEHYLCRYGRMRPIFLKGHLSSFRLLASGERRSLHPVQPFARWHSMCMLSVGIPPRFITAHSKTFQDLFRFLAQASSVRAPLLFFYRWKSYVSVHKIQSKQQAYWHAFPTAFKR